MIAQGASRFLTPALRQALSKRTVVSGPPSRHVSTADKVVLGGGMALAVLIVPAWVVYHIPIYRGRQ